MGDLDDGPEEGQMDEMQVSQQKTEQDAVEAQIDAQRLITGERAARWAVDILKALGERYGDDVLERVASDLDDRLYFGNW